MAESQSTALRVQPLKNDKALWYRLHVFIFDLHNFESDPHSKLRLELLHDPQFLGTPYFDQDQADRLKETCGLASDQTLGLRIETEIRNKLQRRIEKGQTSGDHRICAAHDIAPIIEDELRIRLKEVSKDKTFRKLLKKHGLDPPLGKLPSELG